MLQVEVFTVLEKLALSPEEVCGIIIGDDCATAYNPFEMWNVTFPKIPKPPVKPLTQPKVSMTAGFQIRHWPLVFTVG